MHSASGCRGQWRSESRVSRMFRNESPGWEEGEAKEEEQEELRAGFVSVGSVTSDIVILTTA